MEACAGLLPSGGSRALGSLSVPWFCFFVFFTMALPSSDLCCQELNLGPLSTRHESCVTTVLSPWPCMCF